MAINVSRITGKRAKFYLPKVMHAPKFNVPTIEVSTDGEYVPSIDEIVKQIQSSDCLWSVNTSHLSNKC